MRILWISATFPHPPIDGGAVRAFHLMSGLAARGHQLALVAFGPERIAAESRAAVEAVASPVCSLPRPPPPSLRQRIGWKISRRPSAVRALDDSAMWAAVREACASFRPDVVVGDLIHMAAYAAALPAPRVLNLNDSMALTLEREAGAETSWRRAAAYRFEAARFRRYEAAMAARFARLVVVSPADRDYFAGCGCGGVAVVANGVDAEYYDRARVVAEAGPDPALIFTGNLSHPPNIKAVQWVAGEVLPLVRARVGRVQLRLVGLAPAPDIRQLAERDPQIRVTGFVPDLRPWLAGSQVYVAPMQSGSGIKNKVLEAMAMGVPVVATPLGVEGMPQVVAGREALVAASPQDFAAAVCDLLGDPVRARVMAQHARRLVAERYGWAARAAEFEAVLQGALSAS